MKELMPYLFGVSIFFIIVFIPMFNLIFRSKEEEIEELKKKNEKLEKELYKSNKYSYASEKST